MKEPQIDFFKTKPRRLSFIEKFKEVRSNVFFPVICVMFVLVSSCIYHLLSNLNFGNVILAVVIMTSISNTIRLLLKTGHEEHKKSVENFDFFNKINK